MQDTEGERPFDESHLEEPEAEQETLRKVSIGFEHPEPPPLDPSNPRPGYRWRVYSDGGPDRYGGRHALARNLVVLKVKPKTVRFAFDGEIKKLPRKSFERFLASFQRIDPQHQIT